MAKKDLKVGQRVKFTRTHNTALTLTGKIVSIQDGEVLIETEADGRVIEVSGVESAHADSIAVLSEPKAEEEHPTRKLHRAS